MGDAYAKGLGAGPRLMSPIYWSGWVWPVPVWHGRVPQISDGYQADATSGHRRHPGVDIMFRRLPTDPVKGGEVPSNGYDGSPHYVMPDGVPCIAPFVGKVWIADLSPRGHEIRIDHGVIGGVPINSYVQHLSSFSRPWRRGDLVYPGTILGTVGGDVLPTAYHVKHCHFGLLFFTSPAGPLESKWVNPQPYMDRWWRKIGGDGSSPPPPVADQSSSGSSLGGIIALGALGLGAAALTRRKGFPV